MVENLSIHFCANEGTIETVFRTIISVNQLSIYGAVSDLCEESKFCHVRTGRHVLVGQSDPLCVPSEMKTHTHLRLMILRKKIYCKSTKNERISCHNKIVGLNFVLMQDFLNTVDVGQYFMTKDTSWKRIILICVCG